MPQSLRVLIADDEPEILLYYRAVLARLGHTVLAEAHNGHEFVEQCRELEPDLVISDIAMPGVDGITALERVRTRSMTPFIFVTGNDNSEIRQRAQHQQVVAYLLKPSFVVPSQAGAANATRGHRGCRATRRPSRRHFQLMSRITRIQWMVAVEHPEQRWFGRRW